MWVYVYVFGGVGVWVGDACVCVGVFGKGIPATKKYIAIYTIMHDAILTTLSKTSTYEARYPLIQRVPTSGSKPQMGLPDNLPGVA